MAEYRTTGESVYVAAELPVYPEGTLGLQPPPLPLRTRNAFFQVGIQNRRDADEAVYTALIPFSGSPHCEGIPAGTHDRERGMTANRRGITVADIRFGVENGSNVAVGNPFVVELRHGGRPVKRERVNGLPARGRTEFSYRRRETGARVARLGPGDSC